MENLNKQGGEKTRKMETKVDSQKATSSKSHAVAKEKIKEKVEEQIVKEMAKEIKSQATDVTPEIKKSDVTTPVEENKEGASKTETKKEASKPKVKKEFAHIKMSGLPISTKHSIALCNFIKWKTIDKAMEDLTQVAKLKKAVPMRGEIPHRKGPMMAGRYPITAARTFINVLKSLAGNANVNGVDNPIITIASPSWSSRPQRRGGRRFKRTHLYIEAREGKTKMKTEKNSKKNQNKEKIMEKK